MSGHSKWSTIKHKKGAKDAKRGKLFGKLARAIEVSAREGGGGDPAINASLSHAVAKAKSHSMPNDNIERAIKRGIGDADGAMYEEIWYEGLCRRRRSPLRAGTDRQPQPGSVRRALHFHAERREPRRARIGGLPCLSRRVTCWRAARRRT